MRDPATKRFVPGVSGNPKGRPVGTLGKGASARKRILAASAGIVDQLIKKAQAGDMGALSLCMGVITPALKSQFEAVEVPGAAECVERGDIDGACQAINVAITRGQVAPDVAKQMIEALRDQHESQRLSAATALLHDLRAQLALPVGTTIDAGHDLIRLVNHEQD